MPKFNKLPAKKHLNGNIKLLFLKSVIGDKVTIGFLIVKLFYA